MSEEPEDVLRPATAKPCPRHGRVPSLDCAWCSGHLAMARWDAWPLGLIRPRPYKPSYSASIEP